MLDSVQYGSIKSATQYELKSFVTTGTYWVPDLPNIKRHFWLPSAFYFESYLELDSIISELNKEFPAI